MSESAKKPLIIFIYAGLILSTLLVYWQVSGNDFIYFDDPIFITQNRMVKNGLSWEATGWAFTELYTDYWHPLTWLSMMLDCQMFELQARGHHLVSLGIHILNTLLLFGLLRYVTGRQWLAAFVAGLFALHPMHVESVAWAAERKDVLSTFFWFATMWTYAYYARVPTVRRYAWVVVLFGLGLMSKPMLVTLPLVLLLFDYWPLERFRMNGPRPAAAQDLSLRRLLAEKVPLLAMSVAVMAVTVAGQSKTAMTKLEGFDLSARLANTTISYWWYLAKMAWPTDLNIFYHFSSIPVLADALWPFLLLTLITGIALFLRGSRKYLLVGWLWYLITLLPVIGLVQVGTQAHADRYTYIPLVGVFIAITWAVADAVARSTAIKTSAAMIGAVVLIVLGAVTYRTVGYWKNSSTLFGRAVEIAPDNYFMHSALGAALCERGDFDAAEAEMRTSLGISQTKFALCGLGQVMAKKKRPQDALVYYHKAIAMDPRHYDAWFYGGLALSDLHRYDEANAYLKKALEFRLNPRRPEALFALGSSLRQQGRFDEAFTCYRDALRMDPTMPGAQLDMGLLLLDRHRYDEAIQNFTEAIRLAPDMAQAYVGMGGALSQSGKPEEGLAAFKRAVEIDPNLVAAHCGLAAALAAKGDYQGAAEEYKMSLAIKPDFAAWNNLGDAQLHMKLFGEAQKSFRQAMTFNADNSVVRYNLAMALAELGRKEEALVEVRKSLAIDPNYKDAEEFLKSLGEIRE